MVPAACPNIARRLHLLRLRLQVVGVVEVEVQIVLVEVVAVLMILTVVMSVVAWDAVMRADRGRDQDIHILQAVEWKVQQIVAAAVVAAAAG